MPSHQLESRSESIRQLAAELARLETLIGHPQAPADLEDRVIDLAHRLRNELQIECLAEHSAEHRRSSPA